MLPALPALAADLQAPMAAVQLTMSALILAFGLTQLVWGPVADRFGRRPVLLVCLSLFVVASIGSALAPDITMLVAWRALQGVGMAAAVVCARAMVRDLYVPADGARVMSKALSGLGLIALASPLLGGATAQAIGWRGVLAGVAAFGLATLAWVAWRLPETLVRPNPAATRAAGLWRTGRELGRHPVFVAWALLVACTYGGLFTVLAGSSFVYIDVLGLSPAAYGLAMAAGSLSYIAGTLVCRRWIARVGMAGAVARGGFFTLTGGGLGVALVLAVAAVAVAVLLRRERAA